jgi:hypothetical protein
VSPGHRGLRHRILWRGFRDVTALLLTILFCPLVACPQQDEHAVRAAYVYNLTKYVTWPKAGNELEICVAGGGSFGFALEKVIQGKVSDGRRILVSLRPSEPELQRCDMVYFDAANAAQTQRVLDHLMGHPVLTVGENESFVRAGGMVGLVRSGDQLQIQVNLDQVRAGELRMSSRLLDLAVLVHYGGRR